MIGQFRAVIKNRDREIELQRERRDGLGDMARTGDPQFHRW